MKRRSGAFTLRPFSWPGATLGSSASTTELISSTQILRQSGTPSQQFSWKIKVILPKRTLIFYTIRGFQVPRAARLLETKILWGGEALKIYCLIHIFFDCWWFLCLLNSYTFLSPYKSSYQSMISLSHFFSRLIFSFSQSFTSMRTTKTFDVEARILWLAPMKDNQPNVILGDHSLVVLPQLGVGKQMTTVSVTAASTIEVSNLIRKYPLKIHLRKYSFIRATISIMKKLSSISYAALPCLSLITI